MLSATRRLLLCVVILLSEAVAPIAIGATTDPMAAWTSGMHRLCPANHGEWLVEASAYDALDEFFESLPPRVRSRIDAMENGHACDGVSAGFTCMTYDELRVLRRLHLMHRLVDFSCKHVKCGDVGLCETDRPSRRVDRHRLGAAG